MKHLSDIALLRGVPAPWTAGEKIPWHEPEFSQRMLEFHLSQAHDWASRRTQYIDRHVEWITTQLAPGSRILDLGCGPGLYLQRLAATGYHCTGVDFSPASIRYAQEQAKAHHLDIAYNCVDIRNYTPEDTFNLAMMTFGELNVFRKSDIEPVIHRIFQALDPQGIFLAETHTFEEVRRQGHAPATWQYADIGVFCTEPHLLLEEYFWDEESHAATTKYTLVETKTALLTEYGATMQAYTDDEYRRLFGEHHGYTIHALTEAEWPAGETFQGKLRAYVTRRA